MTDTPIARDSPWGNTTTETAVEILGPVGWTRAFHSWDVAASKTIKHRLRLGKKDRGA